MLRNMLKVTGEELAYEETSDSGNENKGPIWTSKILADQCQLWFQALPEVYFIYVLNI